MGRPTVIITPDGDVYLEDYSGRDRWITAVRFSTTRRDLPGGIPGASTYRFTEDTPADEIAAALAAGAGNETARQYVALREPHTVYAAAGTEGNGGGAANTDA